jgi:hypothetical protein
MAHFAKLDEENNVVSVHAVVNDVLVVNGVESEQAGIDFLTQLHSHAFWKQTSYNGNFRKRYATIGGKYDATFDIFIDPQPFASWALDENFDWQAPALMPTDDKKYRWDEATTSWIEIPTE